MIRAIRDEGDVNRRSAFANADRRRSAARKEQTMGTWGTAAWENDSAADWFAELMETTGLPERVEEALKLDAEDAHEEIRAAAYVLLALGRNFVWPVDKLDAHLTLATEKLREIAELEEYEDSDIVPVIQKEIAELQSRIKR
jgi:hypothetical protein